MTREGPGVLSLRTPVGARLRLRAAGGPPLRATPPPSPFLKCSQTGAIRLVHFTAEGWRGGEVSSARFERDGGPQRQDPEACTGTGARC